MIMTEIESPVNKYIDVYINNYVRQFRNFITSNYIVNIGGVAGFIATDDHDLSFLLRKLQTYGFEVTISNGQDTIDEIQVEYTIRGNANDELLVYKIENLVSTIYLSSKTGISIVGILVMQIISQIICKSKTLPEIRAGGFAMSFFSTDTPGRCARTSCCGSLRPIPIPGGMWSAATVCCARMPGASGHALRATLRVFPMW